MYIYLWVGVGIDAADKRPRRGLNLINLGSSIAKTRGENADNLPPHRPRRGRTYCRSYWSNFLLFIQKVVNLLQRYKKIRVASNLFSTSIFLIVFFNFKKRKNKEEEYRLLKTSITFLLKICFFNFQHFNSYY